MQEPKNIAANWTCEYGNIPHESSRNNVLALARGDRTGGLAIYRAATSWRMPGWNCLKRQKTASARIRFADEGECRTHCSRIKAIYNGKFGYMHLQSSLAYRQQHGRKDLDASQGWNIIYQRQGRNADANSPDIRNGAPADEVIVVMISMIIKGRSEGPLGLTTERSERAGVSTRKG